MKKKQLNYWVLALILTAFIACQKDISNTNSPTSRTVVLTDTLTIKTNETVISGDFSIKLDSISDSRCPLDFYCFTAGWVNAKLLVQKNTNSQIVRISDVPNFDTATVFNYRLRFLSVLPEQTVSANRIPQRDYVIKLLVQ